MLKKVLILVACASSLLLPSLTLAEAPAGVVRLGDITSFTGEVFVRSKGAWGRVESVPYAIFSSDKLVTKRGRAEVSFVDGAAIRVDVDTDLSIVEQKGKGKKPPTRQVSVLVGDVYFAVKAEKGKGASYTLRSPSMTAGVRGSELRMSVPSKGDTLYSTLSGEIDTKGSFSPYANARGLSRADVSEGGGLPLATDRSGNELLLKAAEAAGLYERAGGSGSPIHLADAHLSNAGEMVLEARRFGEAVRDAEEVLEKTGASAKRVAALQAAAEGISDKPKGAPDAAIRAYGAASETAMAAASAELSYMRATLGFGMAALSGSGEAVRTARASMGKAAKASSRAGEKADRALALADEAARSTGDQAEALALAVEALKGAALLGNAEASAHADSCLNFVAGDSASYAASRALCSLAESLSETAEQASEDAVDAAENGDLDGVREAAGVVETAVQESDRAAEEGVAFQEAVETPVVEEAPPPPDTQDLPSASPST